MDSFEIKRVDAETAFIETDNLIGYSFRPNPLEEPFESKNIVPFYDGSINVYGYENGEAVASAHSYTFTQNLRGKVMDISGVWGVVGMPEIRRKGYVRQVMQHLFREIKSEGQCVSMLYPFKDSYYERMGYTLLPAIRTVKFKPSALLPIAKLNFSGEFVRTLNTERVREHFDYVKRVQARQHGFMMPQWKLIESELEDMRKLWMVTVERDGEIKGVMHYNFKPRETLTAHTFFYDDDEALYQLLSWFAIHTDHVSEIQINLPPDGFPETWFTDLKIDISRGDKSPMARVIDVMGLSGIGAGSGNFTARINDSLCEWNDGIYQFSAENGTLQVNKATQADYELDITGLSALVYGAQPAEVLKVRGWTDADTSALQAMNGVFPQQVAYVYETF